MWDFTGAKVGKNIEKRVLSQEKCTLESCGEDTATTTEKGIDDYERETTSWG